MSNGIKSNQVDAQLTKILAVTPNAVVVIGADKLAAEVALGTTGQVLTSNGTTSTPSFQTPAGGGGVPFTGATNIAAGTVGLVPQPAAGEDVYYLKGDGTWAPGIGTPGSVWFSGSGVPSDATGVNSDLYFRTNGLIYQKASGTWGASIANITGPTGSTGSAGAAGAVWFSGSGVPSGGTGANGDFYLRTSNGDVYSKSGGSWSVVTNITGPAGSAGSNGSTLRSGSGAPSNGTGVDGDYYLRTSNNDLYLRSSGTYSVVSNFTGSTGATGSTGSAGAPGAVWRSGSGVPSNGTGVDGDFYLNTANGDVYKRASGTYSVVTNIAGPTGAVMVGSGAGHAAGIAPDPGATPGTTRYLCEDGTYSVPAGGGGSGSVDQIEVWLF